MLSKNWHFLKSIAILSFFDTEKLVRDGFEMITEPNIHVKKASIFFSLLSFLWLIALFIGAALAVVPSHVDVECHGESTGEISVAASGGMLFEFFIKKKQEPCIDRGFENTIHFNKIKNMKKTCSLDCKKVYTPTILL